MMEQNDLWQEERRLLACGCGVICGADETGAGPLAGPVYAAAVILPEGLCIEGLNDSKKLTAKKRDLLFDEICSKALSYAIVSVSAEEIDEIDILNARIKAMDTAIKGLSLVPDMDCEDAADYFARRGIALRAGLHCAPLAHESAGTLESGTLRISFGWDASDDQTRGLLRAASKLIPGKC